MIDLHSHLHDKAFDEDRDFIISQMKEAGIKTITIGTDFFTSQEAINLASKHENILASIGLHPADNKDEIFDYDKYLELAKNEKVVCIGECGLDYFHNKKDKEDIEKQIQIFKEHIRLAICLNKPLMLHVRPFQNNDAYHDAIDILKEAKNKNPNLRGNFHFFVGDVDVAKKILDIGFTMSFSGVITFTKDYDEAIKFVPLDMIHAETDSPYVAPVPFRGKRNSPLFVEYTISKIAEIKNIEADEVLKQLDINFQKFITNKQ